MRRFLFMACSIAFSCRPSRLCMHLQTITPQNPSNGLKEELKALDSMCNNLSKLGPSGAIIRIDGSPAAFAIYDELNPETAVVYFEKAEHQYKGLHQLINQETAKMILKAGYKLINREYDLGHSGLRQAKLSYHPVQMVKSYRLTLKSLL